jgi:tRNA(Ile)-lysidine synthase
MKGRQKLSDYFVHQKFTLEQKEKCWLLCSGQDIVWVVEHRIDNRFKFSERTKTVLEIKVGIDP